MIAVRYEGQGAFESETNPGQYDAPVWDHTLEMSCVTVSAYLQTMAEDCARELAASLNAGRIRVVS